jgi:hypothetical protein
MVCRMLKVESNFLETIAPGAYVPSLDGHCRILALLAAFDCRQSWSR